MSDSRRLLAVLALTLVYFAVELIGGFLSNSLALLTDAVHLLADVGAIGLGLFTLWISRRPVQGAKTYGYVRAEILGALLNGLALWVIVIFIFVEAYHRLLTPPPVVGSTVLAVAAVGIVVNGTSAWLVGATGHSHGIAVRAVLLHVLSDLIGSFGVLTSGAIVYLTRWYRADPIVSILVGLLVLYGSWHIVKEGVDILMESVPSHINIDQVREVLMAVPGTREVHDLHVWCLTSSQLAMSAHAVVGSDIDTDQVLADMTRILGDKFAIEHVTLQIEKDNRREREPGHY